MILSEALEIFTLEEVKLKGKSEKTGKNYRSAVNSFIRCNADISVELISNHHISRWKLQMDREGKQTSTMAHDLQRFSGILKYLQGQGYRVIDSNSIECPQVRHKPPTWLNTDEIRDLLSVVTSIRDKAIIACMFSSGARVSELLGLNRDDVMNGQAHIIGKGGKSGILRFDEVALGYLQEYLESRRDKLTPLFVSGQYRRITVSRVEQLLHIYADAAGIQKNVTPHVLRHSFASDLKLNGADIFDIKTQLRHSRINSTMIYVHVDDKTADNNYNKYHSRVPKV